MIRPKYELTKTKCSLARAIFVNPQIFKISSDGFFLMVEGAKIDHAHHSAYANLALEETLAFENAVGKSSIIQ